MEARISNVNPSAILCTRIYQREYTLAIMARIRREYLGEKLRILEVTIIVSCYMLEGKKVISREEYK